MEHGDIIRLISCDLEVPEDITDQLLDSTLAWIWMMECSGISIVKEEGPYKVEPSAGMYDFGPVPDDDIHSDWLVWSEHTDTSVSVVHDLRMLRGLGVRGSFVIHKVGTMIFEKWRLSDDSIHMSQRELTFEEDPDETIQNE